MESSDRVPSISHLHETVQESMLTTVFPTDDVSSTLSSEKIHSTLHMEYSKDEQMTSNCHQPYESQLDHHRDNSSSFLTDQNYHTSNDCPMTSEIETENRSTLNRNDDTMQMEQNNNGENESNVYTNGIEENKKMANEDIIEEKYLSTNSIEEQKDRLEKPLSSSASSSSRIPVASVLSMIRELQIKGPEYSRVKLYVVNEETGNWEGSAIGAVDLVYTKEHFRLIFRTDPSLDPVATGPAVLLDSAVEDNMNYGIQNDSVITWNDGAMQKGLSFVKKEGCKVLWSCLMLLVPDRIEEEEIEDEMEPVDEMRDDGMLSSMLASSYHRYGTDTNMTPAQFRRESIMQPLPTSCVAVERVLQHLTLLHDPKDPTVLQKLAPGVLREMTEDQWLKSLWNFVNEGVKNHDEDSCAIVAELLCQMVAVYAVSSNPFTHLAASPTSEDRNLDPDDPLARLLSDEHYVNFFRAMEYESELRKHGLKIDHVTFLKDISEFKDVICKEDEAFSVACHFIYRILYLRDVCLPRHLDEATIQRLTIIVNSGYAYICRLILLAPQSLQQLRDTIPEDVNAARFLLQLLTVLRTNIVVTPEKNQIYNSLKNDNVIESLSGYLTGDCAVARQWPLIRMQLRRKQKEAEILMNDQIKNDPDRRHRPQLLSHERLSIPTLPELAIEIFSLSVEHNPSLLRHSLFSKVDATGAPTLWYALCEMFRTTDHPGLQIQLSEIFRKVLDPVTLDDPEKDDLLSKFYDHGVIDRLIDIVLSPPPQTFEDLFPNFPSIESSYFVADPSSDNEGDDNDKDDDLPSTEAQSPIELSSQPQSTTTTNSDDDNDSSNKDACVTLMLSVTPTRNMLKRSDYPDTRPAKRRASTDANNSNRPVPISVPQTSEAEEERTVSLSDEQSSSEISSVPTSNHVPAPIQPIVPIRETRFLRRIRKGLLTAEQKQELLYSANKQLSFSKCQICEILSFCVLKHNFRIKYRNYERHLHVRLIEVACDPIYDQFVALYAIKFLKACLITESDYYSRFFIKHDVFRPVFHILCHCVPKPKSVADGTIVESAILELLHLICRASQQSQAMSTLLKHIVERHSEQVSELNTYYNSVLRYDLFQQLQQQYQALWHPNRRWSSSSFDSSSQRERKSIASLGSAGGRSIDSDFEMNESIGVHWLTGKPSRQFDEEQQRRLNEELYFDFDEDSHNTEKTESEVESSSPLRIRNSVELQFEAFMNSTNKEEPVLPPLSPHFSVDEDDDEDVPDFLRQSPSSSRTSPPLPISSSGVTDTSSARTPRPSLDLVLRVPSSSKDVAEEPTSNPSCNNNSDESHQHSA